MKKFLTLVAAGLVMFSSANGQKKWTLQECIDYALANNILLKRNKLSAASAGEDERASKAAFLPGLSASTNQNVSYHPFSQSTINLTNGTMTNGRAETSYAGNYGINANWTVWNGGLNGNNFKKSRYNRQLAELATQKTANNIQEQIVQLYVQILYEAEALKVDSAIVDGSILQRDRAKERVKIGDLAKVDLAQLEAQVLQDRYLLVSAQSQLAKYKLQLKQLLEIHDGEAFEVAVPSVEDASIMAVIPEKSDIYRAALNTRPEIQSGKLNIAASNLDIAIAKAGYMPKVSMNGSVVTNNAGGTDYRLYTQWKNNWSNTLGLTVSIPIFDNRQAKTAVQKAKIAVKTSELELEDTRKQLYSEIENYWLQASASQKQYIAAKAGVASMQESYNLVSEQFKLGLKNIVELTTGKNNLLQAQQNMLQSKYAVLLNLTMLKFYQGQQMKL